MTYISPNFQREEFACKGCEHTDGCAGGFDTIDAETLVVLEALRQHFDAPVHIRSAARCPAWNKASGGSERSLHMQGRACDVVVEGVSADKVQDWLDNTWPDTYGIGKYALFTHIDTRKHRARWAG